MKLRSQIDSVLEKVLVFIMSLMVINVLWQVFSRYLLANPSSFTDELARYLMIWVGVLGAAYVAGKGNHVAITYFSEKFSSSNLKVNTSTYEAHLKSFLLNALPYKCLASGTAHLSMNTHSSGVLLALLNIMKKPPILRK